MKNVYLRFSRFARLLANVTQADKLLDKWAARNRLGLWVRSLLSIYDVQDLARLDVPWWTFASAAAVQKHLAGKPDARVFEWGSGASTVWLSRRAAHVISVEHDTKWASQMRVAIPRNVELIVAPPAPTQGMHAAKIGSRKSGFENLDFSEYVAAIDKVGGNFDLVVIDGRAREACLEKALNRLAPGGLVVFDNVDRRRYIRALRKYVQVTDLMITRGLTPSLPYPTRTALIRLRDG